jgi:alpha/beta superfamily hydrolase
VIRLHGLPGRSPVEETNALAKQLTDIGISYFAFDFPGIRESEGFYTYRNSFNLAKEIINYFATEHDDIYPKIGLYAESFGGSIALCLANASSIVSSLFLWSPVLNFEVLSNEINMNLIVKFMEDSGVIKLPHYDDFGEAFAIQMSINPPENSQKVFDKLPAKILASSSDILFSPTLIKKELDNQYHHLIQIEDNLDHNLMRNESALKVAVYARNFFLNTLL